MDEDETDWQTRRLIFSFFDILQMRDVRSTARQESLSHTPHHGYCLALSSKPICTPYTLLIRGIEGMTGWVTDEDGHLELKSITFFVFQFCCDFVR